MLQHMPTHSSADEAAVREVYEQVMHAWNRGIGAALAQVFTPMETWSASTAHTFTDARRSPGSTSACSTSG